MSIRTRLALAMATGTAFLYLIVAFISIHQLGLGLVSSVDSDLKEATPFLQRAMNQEVLESYFIGQSGQGGPSGYHIPRSHGSPIFAQLINTHNQVVGAIDYPSSRSLISKSTLESIKRTPLSETITLPNRGGSIRVYAQQDSLLPGFYLIMADPLGTGPNAQHSVTTSLILLFFPVVVLAGLGGWLLASAALRPVEKMRLQAEAVFGKSGELLDPPKTGDELGRLATTMNHLLVDLNRSLTDQRSFVSDAGHELRTPLAILRGELELALKPGRSTLELREAISAAADEASRLSRLADDLLILARGDEGHLQIRPQKEVISDVIASGVARLQPRISEKGQEVLVESQVSEVTELTIELDKTRIQQAVGNILDNAIRWSPPKSTIKVSVDLLATESQKSAVKVTICDHGPGFPEDFIPHAFERFRRPNTARDRNDGGSGLGLAIVKSIIDAHDGQVGVYNHPSSGACVWFTLPVK